MAKTTLGPVVLRECGYCEGTGTITRPIDDTVDTCDLCDGKGTIPVDVAPFVALERGMEHIQAIRTSMGLRRTETFVPKMGTPAYHVDAVEDAISALFQQLVVMLPEEFERTEG